MYSITYADSKTKEINISIVNRNLQELCQKSKVEYVEYVEKVEYVVFLRLNNIIRYANINVWRGNFFNISFKWMEIWRIYNMQME